MQMDSRIILAGQPVNALQALDAGTRAAGNAAQVGRTADLWNLYQDQGAGIMSGDQNALRALAGLDPMAALGVQETQQGMRINEERLQMARQQAARAAQTHAAQISREEAMQLSQQIGQNLGPAIQMLRSGNLDGVNQIFEANGLERANSPEEAAFTIAAYEEALPFYEAAAGVMGQEPEPDVPAAMQTLQLRAEAAGLQPGTEAYEQFMLTGGRSGPETVVNVNSGMPEDAFTAALGEQEAANYATFMETGQAAARNIARLDQLDGLLRNVETGFGASARLALGNFGIPTDGLSDLQAAQALINQMVPEQRQPGSGPMSDADLRLFQQSVPRLINQPGGNAIIIETIRQINEYDVALGQIAQSVASGELTRAQARERVARLQNPLENFGNRISSVTRGSENFSQMSLQDLLRVNIEELSGDQLNAYEARWREVNR